jgi:two-component system sensor histidine kinase AlgZ
MPGFNEPLLVNIIGHAAGALIFAIFLVLLFSGRGWSGARGRYLSGLAAGLALAWNAGSLAVLLLPHLSALALNLIVAASFSVLSLLPAVLLHLWLEDRQRPVVVCGYLLSSLAVAMHFWEVGGENPTLHQSALLLITAGFLILTGIAVGTAAFRGGAPRKAEGGRITASMCLALFAMSFIHFGGDHPVQAWSGELIIHHAGIPLALLVLLQDYRFVLLDAFVRFLANALLAAGVTWLMIRTVLRLATISEAVQRPVAQAILLISVCLFLVLFAWLRDRAFAWLTQAVFRQDRVTRAAAELKSAPAFRSEEEYLNWASGRMATALNAVRWEVTGRDRSGGADLRAPILAGALPALGAAVPEWVEAIVPLRLTQGDSRLLLFGRRRGGQRYLRDDLDALAEASSEIATHVESLRAQEMARLVAQAELRALQSQINPHFLFNALNTLYGTIPRGAPGARQMVLNLAEIFRYFLQSDKMFVPLSHEMQIVRAYLEIEKRRLGDRLTIDIMVEDAALPLPIPVLSIQPLVENAIKHGVAQRTEPGYVSIRAQCSSEELMVMVENSSAPGGSEGPGTGVGLQNVRRRLEICYGQSSQLELSLDGERATAQLRIPIALRAEVHT